MNRNRILSFAGLVICAIALVHTNPLPSRSQTDSKSAAQSQEKDIPTVDYPMVQPADDPDVSRKSKGKRHDKELAVRDRDTGGKSVLTFSHWDAALPALPVGRSATVVVGQVLKSKAFLSNDKTGIYSEFEVSVEQVLKNDSATPIFQGGSVTAERRGGRVRFPSGRLITYGNRGQGMPKVGQRYVFFLERNADQYTILTAYELQAGKVRPLDGKNAPGGENSEWPGNDYQGTDESSFMIEVARAVAGVRK
jgi:hypothetical protein